MTLAAGQSLTHYEILGPLGAGGMGEVWRARDTRLDREVAIKVLPEAFAADADRLRRFEREAKTLASLNHPNVAGIHGVDQVGDICFLALELVPGEDLAQRLGRGPLPVDEALDVCRQIAAGLEAAHEAGVVHRDLKPANVRITPEGTVKLLDFGLAKPIVPKASSGSTTTAESDSFLMTGEGVVLGTPTYMSPEQARGKPVDRRTDVWCLGCVLYECLTGRRAFGGDSMPDVLAGIVGNEPDWSRLPAVPARVSELLRRLLTKDPRTRLRDAGEARVQLSLSAGEPVGSNTRAGAGPARAPLRSAALTATLSLAALLAGLWIGSRLLGDPLPTSGSERPRIHAMLNESGAEDTPTGGGISPDGTRTAWLEGQGLHVRVLGEREPRTILAGHKLLGMKLAWSPDGRQIAFVDDKVLWRIPAEGGTPVRFAAFGGVFWTNLQWMDDGRIAHIASEGIVAVAEGGEPTILVPIDRSEVAHLHGFVLLPDGQGALAVPHLVGGGAETIEIFHDDERMPLVSTPGTEPQIAHLASDGSLFWLEGAGGPLWRVPFSLEDLEFSGERQLVIESCHGPSLSNDGTLIYAVAEGPLSEELVWIDRTDGSFASLGDTHPNIWGGKFSNDGQRIIFTTNQGSGSETWVHDIERDVSTVWIRRDDGTAISRFLDDGRIGVVPITTSRGTFVYPPSGKGEPELVAGVVEAVVPGSEDVIVRGAGDVDGDGVYTEFFDAPTYLIGSGGHGEQRLLLSAEHGEQFLTLSKDGAWMLHSSERTGERQVYLTRFPPREDEEWPVSAGGADAAWFADDNAEILFRNELLVYRVSVQTSPVVRLGTPEPLFQHPPSIELRDYDGSGRFVGRRMLNASKLKVYVDTNWER